VETLQPPYHLFRRDIEAEILPYTAAHDIGVLVYGPLAHGLLTGHMSADTTFAPGDWRGRSDMFTGAGFERNLQTVAELDKFSRDELGVSVDQLATAWTLANPAVQVAIIGTRRAVHVDAAVAASDLQLDAGALASIEQIMRSAQPATGPSPDSV
jgi:aryl-alcohol dehydrogenase-like predicted oxidoreductase